MKRKIDLHLQLICGVPGDEAAYSKMNLEWDYVRSMGIGASWRKARQKR